MKRFYIYLFAAFCTVFLGACTGNFRDMNAVSYTHLTLPTILLV